MRNPAFGICDYQTCDLPERQWSLICTFVLGCLDSVTLEPRCEKTGLQGFRPGPTQTRLYDHTRWLEA